MLTGLMAGASVQALAVPATCQSLGIQNNVSPNAGCQIGSTNNDKVAPPPLQVNVDQMFGYTDWIFGEKTLEGMENVDTGLEVIGTPKSGFWFIDDSIWDLYSDVMIVLKGGNAAVPSQYVGYLLMDGQDWGTYLSPFMNGTRRMDISHFSIYLREGASQVAEPATLALIGLGLMGLAYLRRRRS